MPGAATGVNTGLPTLGPNGAVYPLTAEDLAPVPAGTANAMAGPTTRSATDPANPTETGHAPDPKPAPPSGVGPPSNS